MPTLWESSMNDSGIHGGQLLGWLTSGANLMDTTW